MRKRKGSIGTNRGASMRATLWSLSQPDSICCVEFTNSYLCCIGCAAPPKNPRTQCKCSVEVRRIAFIQRTTPSFVILTHPKNLFKISSRLVWSFEDSCDPSPPTDTSSHCVLNLPLWSRNFEIWILFYDLLLM